ncbi:MAG: TIGR03960 family B12-binding radical SAM protein [Candidatus Omnitrophota bacterium]
MEDILLKVRKPARYIGVEFNSIVKNWRDCAVKFAICFPNTYEVGMSNLGLRIIYGLLNIQNDYLCERFFLPDLDMLDFINNDKAKFCSLESGRPLSDFDIVGFSIQHELDYANILHMLKLGSIPFYSKERSENQPLIIAGGPALSNPEPVADFFDLILIGEAEEALLEITSEFKDLHDKLIRWQLLERLAKIEGIYVPVLYEPIYDSESNFQRLEPKSESAPTLIKHRFVKNLDSSFFPTRWLVPYIQIVHDKILLELMRGCPRGCNFCQARVFYSPLRIRSKEKIIELALSRQKESGYEEISLLGLSVCDHPFISEVVADLIDKFKDKCVAVSLGSLRPEPKISELLDKLKEIKKPGLTLAIESASEWLRNILNKKVDLEELKQLVEKCYNLGYRRIKFYFMFGLPFENQKDLEAIAELLYNLAHIEGFFRKDILFTVSINPFIPKPQTVFQWHPMEDLASLKSKKSFLMLQIARKMRNVKVDFRSLEASFLEALLSRGDRRFSKLIIAAFQRGAIFDSYGDHFNYSIWLEALKETQINAKDYVYREISATGHLIWGHIDMGFDKQKLRKEYENILELGKSR